MQGQVWRWGVQLVRERPAVHTGCVSVTMLYTYIVPFMKPISVHTELMMDTHAQAALLSSFCHAL